MLKEKAGLEFPNAEGEAGPKFPNALVERNPSNLKYLEIFHTIKKRNRGPGIA
jgi:hypothetical protein